MIFRICFGADIFKKTIIGKAVVADKNEIFFGDVSDEKEIIPIKVRNKIISIVNCYLGNLLSVADEDVKSTYKTYKAENIYDLTYVLNISSGIKLYVTRVKNLFPVAYITYFIIAYDPQSDSLSNNCAVFSGKNMDEYLPLKLGSIVHVEKDQSDGDEKIICKEVGHNGTVYNSIINNYFILNKDLSFKRILTLEEQLVDLYQRGNVILRTIKYTSAREITVDVYTLSSDEKIDLIGKVFLEQNGKEDLFKINKKTLLNKKYNSEKIFCDNYAEDNFIQHRFGDFSNFNNCVLMP